MKKKEYRVEMIIKCDEGAQRYIAQSVCDGLEEPTCVKYIVIKEVNEKEKTNSKNPKYYPKPPNTVAKKVNIGKKGTVAENKVFAVYKLN